jgi:drug/metabolite transporter (DMT)-like permease
MTAVTRGRRNLGFALTALCALGFAVLASLVRLIYAGGADAATVTLSRAGACALLFAAVAAARGQPVLPPPGLRLWTAAIGVLWLTGTYSYVQAIGLIPIGLAATIFYLFPLLVAVIAWAVGAERLSAVQVAALVVGFAGVALAVGVSGGAIAPAGVAYALAAAVSLALNISLSARVMRAAGTLTAISGITGAWFLAMLALLPWTGAALPAGAEGWSWLGLGMVVFCVSTASFYAAITLIGPVRTATICNLEPASAAVFAFLILGEALGPVQILGIVLVVTAIVWLQLSERYAAAGKG